MKRVLILLTAIMATVGLQAQPQAGTFSIIPKVGVSIMQIHYSNILTSDKEEPFSTDSKSLSGVTAGVDFQYQVSNMVAVSAGAMYARQGARFDDSDLTGLSAGSYTAYSNQRLCNDYLLIPILAHVYVYKGLAVELGIQPGFLLGSRSKYRQQTVTISKEGDFSYGDFQEKDESSSDLLNKTDWSIPVGLSYEYENVVIDCRYNFGISNVYKLVSGDKNRGFHLTVGYKFNL